jgi:hypothetical protein
MDVNWKLKIVKLRETVLISSHQVAISLPPAVEKTLEIFRRLRRLHDHDARRRGSFA